MEKCVHCQFYDRQSDRSIEGKSAQWAQCRRSAPMLHPINAKSFMIEGVWPHVREDDWCGEWKARTQQNDVRGSQNLPAAVLTTTNLPAMPAVTTRPGAMSVVRAVAPATAGQTFPISTNGHTTANGG